MYFFLILGQSKLPRMSAAHGQRKPATPHTVSQQSSIASDVLNLLIMKTGVMVCILNLMS